MLNGIVPIVRPLDKRCQQFNWLFDDCDDRGLIDRKQGSALRTMERRAVKQEDMIVRRHKLVQQTGKGGGSNEFCSKTAIASEGSKS